MSDNPTVSSSSFCVPVHAVTDPLFDLFFADATVPRVSCPITVPVMWWCGGRLWRRCRGGFLHQQRHQPKETASRLGGSWSKTRPNEMVVGEFVSCRPNRLRRSINVVVRSLQKEKYANYSLMLLTFRTRKKALESPPSAVLPLDRRSCEASLCLEPFGPETPSNPS